MIPALANRQHQQAMARQRLRERVPRGYSAPPKQPTLERVAQAIFITDFLPLVRQLIVARNAQLHIERRGMVAQLTVTSPEDGHACLMQVIHGSNVIQTDWTSTEFGQRFHALSQLHDMRWQLAFNGPHAVLRIQHAPTSSSFGMQLGAVKTGERMHLHFDYEATP